MKWNKASVQVQVPAAATVGRLKDALQQETVRRHTEPLFTKHARQSTFSPSLLRRARCRRRLCGGRRRRRRRRRRVAGCLPLPRLCRALAQSESTEQQRAEVGTKAQ